MNPDENRYLVTITNDPRNKDLENNYEGNSTPNSCKNIFLLAETSNDTMWSVSHMISIENLTNMIISLKKEGSETYRLLKSAMILADARLQVMEMAKEKKIGSFLDNLLNGGL